jgi:hypothetical protein
MASEFIATNLKNLSKRIKIEENVHCCHSRVSLRIPSPGEII